jgi:probable rRNA maturation factor
MNKVDVIIECDLWEKESRFDFWELNLNNILDAIIKDRYFDKKQFSVNLLLTGNVEIKELNYKFRAQNKATNVLSFPQFSPETLSEIAGGGEIFLGDIAMAYEKILEESNNFNIEFFKRCSHLFVHGVLHLLGMAHADNQSGTYMENVEIKILNLFGIKNPYNYSERKDI